MTHWGDEPFADLADPSVNAGRRDCVLHTRTDMRIDMCADMRVGMHPRHQWNDLVEAVLTGARQAHITAPDPREGSYFGNDEPLAD